MRLLISGAKTMTADLPRVAVALTLYFTTWQVISVHGTSRDVAHF